MDIGSALIPTRVIITDWIIIDDSTSATGKRQE
jgi:hypothetical protein